MQGGSTLGPLADSFDLSEQERRLAKLTHVDSAAEVVADGRSLRWTPYAYSLREGVEGGPGHQGYHGLKGEVTGDFIALGTRRNQQTTTACEREPGGTRYSLWMSVALDRKTVLRAVTGARPPGAVWIDGARPRDLARLTLGSGRHSLLLRYDAPGRYHFVLEHAGAPVACRQTEPLAMSWFGKPGVLDFDPRPEVAAPVGRYRFMSAPGLRSISVAAFGSLEAWADGVPMRVSLVKRRPDNVREWRAEAVRPNALANHYTTIPTRYRGALTSGLPGPVRVRIATFAGFGFPAQLPYVGVLPLPGLPGVGERFEAELGVLEHEFALLIAVATLLC